MSDSILCFQFTLYFYQILSRQTTPADMKSLTSRAGVDYVGRIAAFIRRSEAFNVCMVLDTRELDPYQSHGYHLPLDIKETPSGVGAFPAIFSFPGVCILVVLGRLLKFPREFSTTPG